MKKILLAVDGSEKSEKAAKKTAELVADGNEVTIMTVVVSTNIYHSEYYSLYSTSDVEKIMEKRKQKIQETGEEILNKNEAILKETDINITINKMLRSGDPAEHICREAEKGEFDLIILADKGEGGVKRFLLGSTSDKVVRHAKTSVLIVK
ncbi:MAG: universal stress protein [Halanaerobiales bacterium]